MKFTAIYILIASLHVSAKGFSQEVTLSEKNAKLEKLFKSIKEQTGFVFFYDQALLQQAKPVTIQVKDAPLESALSICFRDQPLSYSIVGTTIVVKQKEIPALPSVNNITQSPPPIDITGKVTDSDGNPLSGATVKVKGSLKATTTNSDGVFVLKGVDDNATLEISYVGFKTYTVAVNNKTTLVAILKLNTSPLEEMQVIAYGNKKVREQTGNVSMIKAKEIANQPVSNLLLALQARVPGLLVTQNTGVPGGAVSVRIQGQNSLSKGNEPYYIVDGVPYPSENLSTTSNPNLLGNVGAGGGSPFAFINPSDIESISVLKDADATAIYGSRAANGAVIITTKKGKAGQMKVDVSFSQGWGKVAKTPELMNSSQYAAMRRETIKNNNTVPEVTKDYDILNLYGWDTARYTNWVKVLMGETAKLTNANVSISGGTSTIQYLVAGTYKKETSVFYGNFANEFANLHYSLNANSSNEKFNMQFSGISQINTNTLPQTDLAGAALTLAPTAPTLYNSDGTLNWAVNAAGSSTWTNPLQSTLRNYENNTRNHISNLLLSYKVLPDLYLKCTFGYNQLQTNTISGSPLTAVAPQSLATAQRRATYTLNNIETWIIEPQLTYAKIFRFGKLDFLGGTTIQQNNNSGQSLDGAGYNSDAVLKDMRSAATLTATSSVVSKYKYNALFGRLNFNFFEKYIVNLSARRDGSSRFGSANRFNNFGAIGAAWLFSKESLFNNLSFLSFGKLKASYGTTGNDQIGDYTFMSLYDPVSASIPYQNLTGLRPDKLTNPYLQWEETRKFNAGIDLGFLKEKIQLSANYAINNSSNQLLSYALPIITGWNSIVENFPAKIRNTSVELSLSYSTAIKKNISWNSSVNFTLPENKLVEFKGLPTSSYANSYVIGEPVNIKKVFHYIGIDPVTGIYTFSDKNHNVTSTPSSSTDAVILVSTFPKYYGGWSNSFSIKGLQLDFLFQFVKQLSASSWKYGSPYTSYVGTARFNQPTSVIDDHWQKLGDAAIVQKYGSASSSAFSSLLLSDAVYSDASYIRLKNIAVSYQLPEQWIKKAQLKYCRLFLQAQNLITITNFKGGDPESSSFGVTGPMRMTTIGIQLGL